jgi:DNA polymerase phi
MKRTHERENELNHQENESSDSDDDDESGVDEPKSDERFMDDESDDQLQPTTDHLSLEAAPNDSSTLFLDSFYGIASLDSSERAASARVMIHHCLLAKSSNAVDFSGQMKDASYALRRLLNGLCSGRAAARQGNAAALSSFLKVAASLDLIKAIRAEWFSSSKNKFDDKSLRESAFQSDLAFVRYALMTVTEPTANESGHGGRSRKASEERDLRFGRLFGVSAIARSGILLSFSVEDLDETLSVAKHLVADLIELYRYKKWMREPVAHAICSLLLALDGDWQKNPVARQLIAHLVENAIIPQFLCKGDNENELRDESTIINGDSGRVTRDLVHSYSAEQIAVALCIQFLQRQFQLRGDDVKDNGELMNSLSYPLNPPLFSVEGVPLMASALVETSSVTQPRLHLVWDVIFLYLTDSCSAAPSKAKVDWRQPAASAILGENFDDRIGALIRHVVLNQLLEVGIAVETRDHVVSENKGSKNSKGAMDRLSLALCLVRNFSGVEFLSSLRGNTRLILTVEQLETHIFTSDITQHLFLEVVCVSGKSKQHSLKSFALHVLDQMVNVFSNHGPFNDGTKQLEEMNLKRLSFAFALLRCDSRFDSKTKTLAVESLLGFARKGNQMNEDNTIMKITVRKFMDFLQSQILNGDVGIVSAYSIQGYVDQLFHLGKKLDPTDNDQGASVQEILGFLFAVAFFDCGSIQAADTSVVSKKKKKSKIRQSVGQKSPIASIGSMIKEVRLSKCLAPVLPYEVRTVASARLFSLLTDRISATVHSAGTEKESQIVDLLWQVHEWRSHLLASGAKQITSFTVNQTDDMDTNSYNDPESIVSQLVDAARNPHENNGTSLTRWKKGCAILALTLSMHLLSCGSPGINVDDIDPDADDDEDYEDTVGFLNDLNHLVSLFSKQDAQLKNQPLSTLAELCARVLSCPLGVGNQSRGASPTLLREAVKFAWVGGLSIVASEKADDTSSLNTEVIRILLNSIGAFDDNEDSNDGEEDDISEDDDRSNSSDKGLFSDNTSVAGVEDQRMDETHNQYEDPSIDMDDDDEEEVNSSKLQALLEEDSDADVDEGELEHHEGADAALAKLIRLKQDARKAGLLARERTEIARQMRCMFLIEVLVVGKKGTWGPLLHVDLIMQLVLPILQYRYEIVKSLAKAIEKRSSIGSPEKVALVNRLTALLRNKILKAKVADLEWSESFDVSNSSQGFASTLLTQAMKTNEKDHQALCAGALIYMLRGISDADLKLKCASVYANAVTLWASKRTCKLDVLFFESLIFQYPVLAQACLGEALATAATNGRSSFIKSESYRLLSLLFNPKLNASVTAFEQLAMKRIIEASGSVLASIVVSVNDTEMIKTKRVRDVLRATDKVILFLSTTSNVTREHMTELNQIEDRLKKIKETNESQGIVKSIDNLMRIIEDLSMSSDVSRNSNEPSQKNKDDDFMDVETSTEKADTSKSKKKKKSKKR